MTRDQIEEAIAYWRVGDLQPTKPTRVLLAAAERALLLEDVLLAARDVTLQEGLGRPSFGVATTSWTAMRKLCAAIDAAEGGGAPTDRAETKP